MNNLRYHSARQQRSNNFLANAVARGLNILAVRDETVARKYLEYKGVPQAVILRVLHHPDQRRPTSAQQAASEAILPVPDHPGQAGALDDDDAC